ncbi:YfhD family protein [Ureibacillus composti]|nr:YfhD family protein [Ureibacillus composti]HWJ77095.1 YfhD family protein [Niallia sp.]
MGRDDNKSHSNNKNTLPQTPKNQKIAPNKVEEEISQELSELRSLVAKNKRK